MIRFFRKYHKWPGLIFTLFILLFAASGIILNHRSLLSSVDVNRKWLPENYRYKNWNLAAIKGSIQIAPDSILLYGNVGVWRTDSSFSRFAPLNTGFPKGIDNRKIASLAYSPGRSMYAGTLFGLYRFDPLSGNWHEVPLPVREQRIVKVLYKGDSLLVLTRSNLLISSSAHTGAFRVHTVPSAEDEDRKTGLFKTLWVIHSGEIYGNIGRLFVDLVGLSFLVICITGLIWFLAPYLLKRCSERWKSSIRRFNLASLRWHNRLGSWLVVILLLTTLTGMFLRPPLLIPIAETRVGKIRHTELDDPNPWFDRFRDVIYDDSLHSFLFATSEGIYTCGEGLDQLLLRPSVQPPVSVMGINVFDLVGPGVYRVGSFSGIFLWDPAHCRIEDHFTKTPYVETGHNGSPFGNVSVAGYLRTGPASDLIFDYAGGAIALSGTKRLPAMPQEMIRQSPISLWNAALEIHTGRIWEPLLGKFYILIVPVTGLATLFIIVTGFFSWYLKHKKTAALSLLRKRFFSQTAE